MKAFKLRASKGGVLLQTGKMGAGAKTYAEEWLISQLTGKKKRIESKYLKSGREREPDSIKRAAAYFGVELVKNKLQLENDFFTGEFDTKTSDTIIDVKSSWDAFTFPFFMKKPDEKYVRQLQIYLALTGFEKASLVYCLENGTDDMVESLAWKIAKEQGADEPDIEHWTLAEQELNYDHLDPAFRIKVFNFTRDNELIKNMEQSVCDLQKYIETELLTQLKF